MRTIQPGARVVIVGAGVAGLHAAHLLRRRGVSDIVVLEGSDRVGGKCHTHDENGVRLELGACFLHNGYHEVRRLLAELCMAPSQPFLAHTVMLDENLRAQRATYDLTMPIALRRYSRLRRRLLDDPGEALRRRPSPSALQVLARPAAAVLEEHGVWASLSTLMRMAYSGQGYGHLEEVSSLYAFLWLQPVFLRGLLMSAMLKPLRALLPPLDRRLRVSHYLPEGYSALIRRLAGSARTIELNAVATAIERPAEGPVRVHWRRGDAERSSEADWLLWTPPLSAASTVFQDPDPIERRWFSEVSSATLVTTAYTDDPIPACQRKDVACGYFVDRLRPAGDGRWVVDRHDGAIWPTESPDAARVRVAFQYARASPDPSTAEATLEQLTKDWRAAGRTQATPLMTERGPLRRVWAYAPRFSAEAVHRGAPWEVLERQGRRRTFWLGASTWFESVEHVLRYNRAVLLPGA